MSENKEYLAKTECKNSAKKYTVDLQKLEFSNMLLHTFEK